MTALDWVCAAAATLLTAWGLILLWLNRRSGATPPAPPATDAPNTGTVTALLRPDDPALPDDDAALIAAAVARAVDRYASYLIALRDGMPADVVASLREQMYADLRDSLTPAQLARALVIGLHPHADDRARALLDTDDLSTEHLES